MAITSRSTVRNVAAQVSQALSDAGITAVLTGGSAVSIHAANRYRSYDLDFVTAASRRDLTAVMATLGFVPGSGRHFTHPATRLVVEFVAWPVTVGDEVVRTWSRLPTPAGTLQILTPLQCVQDRLAAFYHWRDTQGLEQALLVAQAHRIPMAKLESWSQAEGHAADFAEFRRRLRRSRRVSAPATTGRPRPSSPRRPR